MSNDKIFCGSGKIVKTKFGDLTKISFSQTDVDTLQANMNNGWINLVLKERQNKVEGKPTHYLEVDTWKKDNAATNETASGAEDSNDDLPF